MSRSRQIGSPVLVVAPVVPRSYARVSPEGNTNAWQPGDYKTSAQSVTHSDPGGGTWYICDGTPLPVGETTLIALVGANTPDARGRALVMQGTHADVDAIGDNDGVALASRRPAHNSTVVQPTISTPAITQPTITVTIAQATGNTTPDSYRNVALDLMQTDASDVSDGNFISAAATGAALASAPIATGGTVGPGGTAPVDEPAYIVPGNLFIHS